MGAEKGSAFLLKVGNGGSPPVFATVAGMRNGLHQTAAALVAIRSILAAMAKAIIYLRNLTANLRG